MSYTVSLTFKYGIGQIVFIITDEEQYEYMVTGYELRAKNYVIYMISSYGKEIQVEEYEITDVKKVK